MLMPVQRIVLIAVVALLVASAVLAVLSMLPREWLEGPPEPAEPLAVELIAPDRAAPARPTRGMTVAASGFGTILSAPARSLVPSAFPDPPGAATLTGEPLVAAQAAGLIRLFPRLAPVPPSDELVTFDLVEASPVFGTIILRDGCLKLAEPGEPHAILPAGTKLTIDSEGFLTAGVSANGEATNPRIGEPAWWPEAFRPRAADAAAVARIRATCGPGAVIQIGPAQSLAASQSAADGAAARNIVNMYGLPFTTALTKVRACRIRLGRNSGIDPQRMITNPCGSTPPSPVADQRSCPAGTTLSGGLCRTPEGHIRPIPAL